MARKSRKKKAKTLLAAVRDSASPKKKRKANAETSPQNEESAEIRERKRPREVEGEAAALVDEDSSSSEENSAATSWKPKEKLKAKTTPEENQEEDADSSATEEYVPNELTTKEILKIKLDLPKLEVFLDVVKERLSTAVKRSEKDRYRGLKGVVEFQIEVWHEENQPQTDDAEGNMARVADIDFKIKTNRMSFQYDYRQFEQRVSTLFQWHKKGKRTYLAPYFPIIQSSGMGKTKLMYELKKRYKMKNRKVFLILCVDPGVKEPNYDKEMFDIELVAPQFDVRDFEQERIRIREILDTLVSGLGENTQAVLCFDEAQLLVNDFDGFAFRAVRWWLRWNTTGIRVIGIFAGTTPNLMYLGREDSNVSRFSRDPQGKYYNGDQLYDPFYQLCTIGLEKNRRYRYEATTDLDGAVRFGRPLFALLAMEEKLSDDILRGVLTRMILNENVGETLSSACCLSILGTRVQMGQTTMKISSQLVADGYACLTDCSTCADIANICFVPDPVCAYLAMKMMSRVSENSKLYGDGRGPKFWSRKATEIFSTSLRRPNKGDVGEVAAALYLLFCGDVLRTGKQFVVSLSGLLQLAAKPSNFAPKVLTAKVTVSFIQVCRNYLRHEVSELTLPTSECLKEWFTAGCAFYACPNCPAYDIIAPVRVESGRKEFSYHAMLISVKNRTTYTEGSCDAAIKQMTSLFQSPGDKIGICVLVLIGLRSGRKSTKCDTNTIVAKKVGNWDGNSILSMTIEVPVNDCFGCWDMATQSSNEGGEKSEIYASHLVAHQTADTDKGVSKARGLMRKGSKKVNVLKDLISAYVEKKNTGAQPC